MKKGLPTKKEIFKRVVIILVAALLIAALLIAVYLWEKGHSDYSGDILLEEVVEFEGQKYQLRSNVETMLIMGLDKFGDSVGDASYNNDRQADFLLLLVFDKEREVTTAIQINRDTMTEVSVLGLGGKKVGTVTQQVALAHTYGTGSGDSCKNTVEAVSKILGGVKINHYLSITMDVVALINDAIGGVTLTVKDDLTSYSDRLVKGEELTLKGDEALIYVRSRYSAADSSNKARMERQRQYLEAMYTQMTDSMAADDDVLDDVILDASEYIVTDCTSAQLELFLHRLSSYDNAGIHAPQGNYVENQYVEFYPDANATQKMLIEVFYKLKED